MSRTLLLSVWLLTVGFVLGEIESTIRETARIRHECEAIETETGEAHVDLAGLRLAADGVRDATQRLREQVEALQTQPWPPVHPPLVWPPPDGPKPPHVCPPGCGAQLPVVTVPMHAEEMP